MQAKEALKSTLTSTRDLLGWYVSDLSDQDLTVRPVPNANNIAWQMGHLIEGEIHLGSDLPGASYPPIPASIKGKYDKASASGQPSGGYLSKNAYMELFNQARTATLAN